MGFTFRRVETGDTSIISSVTGTVISETVILCRDALLIEGERQEGTVSVLGEYLILCSHVCNSYCMLLRIVWQ